MTRDGIERGLDAIFAQYLEPPTEMDLRGLDPATLVLGIGYGFSDWQTARVAANNRRHVATARKHWDEHHVSDDFLAVAAAGNSELAVRSRLLIERAHGQCQHCAGRLATLRTRTTGQGS